MVHALKEAWRVLVPRGTLVDVRPLSINVPLTVVADSGWQVAGEVDLTPESALDIAADQAINCVLEQGLFTQASLEIFDYVYIWKTFHGMLVDFDERWQGEIIVPKEVLGEAQRLYKASYPRGRLRLPMRMKLGVYQKLV